LGPALYLCQWLANVLPEWYGVPVLNVSALGSALKDQWAKVRELREVAMQKFVLVGYESATSRPKTLSVFETLGRKLGAIISFFSYKRRSTYVLLAVILFSLVFATGAALTRRPWCDEGWFASIGYSLIHRGMMGMSVLDPHGYIFHPNVEGIDRYTYWVMPGYPLMQAAWYKVLGVSLFSMRSISLFWGVVALLSWYVVVQWLTGDRPVALLATLLLGTEQHFAFSAATGRMDMMCAALGLLSLALYIRLRRNFTLALFIASCVSAINLFTHPNAIFGMFALAVLILYFDRNRITLSALLLASCPFLVLGSLWGFYITRAPHFFVAQFQAQSRVPHRLELPWNPWKSLLQEIELRYASSYALDRAFPENLNRIVPALYLAAIIVVVGVSQLRREAGVRILLIFTAISFVLLMCFQKNWYYLVFIIPYYTALLAVASAWFWRKYVGSRAFVVALLVPFLVVQLGILSFRIVHNDYRGRYLKAVDFLKQDAKPGDLIMGSGELAFELGFDGQVLDDARLGFYTGKKPEYIVLEAHYRYFWLPTLEAYEPKVYRYIADLFKNKYELVYDQIDDSYTTYGFSDRPYQILKRKSVPLR
jgi:4-amino-4-deoxy-L-arabinose transferase-like glycosyltransferase